MFATAMAQFCQHGGKVLPINWQKPAKERKETS